MSYGTKYLETFSVPLQTSLYFLYILFLPSTHTFLWTILQVFNKGGEYKFTHTKPEIEMDSHTYIKAPRAKQSQNRFSSGKISIGNGDGDGEFWTQI